MEQLDVIVVGVGAMGSAACCAFARHGLATLGIEQFDIGHEFGSSHGHTRVIRKAYFEDPRYVPMARQAFTLWRDLEAASGETLLHASGCLNLGPPAHPCVLGVRTSAEVHGLPFQMFSAAEIHARWPAMEPNPGDVGVFEEDAGFLYPERCIAAMVGAARSRGCRFEARRRVMQWRTDGGTVVVETDGGEYRCRQLVITAGPWLPQLAAKLRLPLRVERQVQTWFNARRPELFTVGSFPIFIHFLGDRSYYGIPAGEQPWVKIARHHGGLFTTADTVNRSVTAADETDIRCYIQRHLPFADGPLMEAKVCLYTNTPDDHFIIDRHPDSANVVIAGGFSGHGFKFAPVVGQMLCDMVIRKSGPPPVDMFSIGRLLKGRP